MARYYCIHCGKIVRRDSNKKWVKSWCSMADRTVYLQRVTGKHLADRMNRGLTTERGAR